VVFLPPEATCGSHRMVCHHMALCQKRKQTIKANHHGIDTLVTY
jgi:hypothetical protein